MSLFKNLFFVCTQNNTPVSVKILWMADNISDKHPNIGIVTDGQRSRGSYYLQTKSILYKYISNSGWALQQKSYSGMEKGESKTFFYCAIPTNDFKGCQRES